MALVESRAQHRSTTVELQPWDGLSSQDRRQWRQLRAANPELRSPFFSLAFFDAVQAVRSDVLVGVIREHDEPVGFFPFHRVGRVAKPVGRFLNDAHNVIAGPDTTIDWLSLLARCQVRAFDFHALVGGPPELLQKYGAGTVESFRSDLGDDSEAFLEHLRSRHRTIFKQAQKTRKLGREIGPLQLEVDCRDPQLLEQTLDWKRAQYRRTNILDLFSLPWTRDLMKHFHQHGEGEAKGVLSVLRAGDTVVAAHFGLREGELLHYWFPCYSPEFGRYSPGTALFTELVRQASQHGIRCIDMGYGEQPYKRKQTETVTTVGFGCVSRSTIYRRCYNLALTAKPLLKKIPGKESLKRVLRTLHPSAGVSKLR